MTFHLQEPTTRSVFLRKSAPPARFSFASSRDAWLVKQLSESSERLFEIVLDPSKPDIKRGDELRWSAAYRELEALERLLQCEAKQASQKTIGQSKIEETIGLLCAKMKSLHVPLKTDEDDGAFALLYISWELTMRIHAALGMVPDPAS